MDHSGLLVQFDTGAKSGWCNSQDRGEQRQFEHLEFRNLY